MSDHNLGPVVGDTMHKFLGVHISELEKDVTEALSKPLIPITLDTSLSYKEAKNQFRKAFLTALLQRHLGNVSEVADIAGLKRETVHRLIKQLRIPVSSLRNHPAREYERSELVRDVVEESVKKYEPALHPEKIEALYKNIDDISKKLARELPQEWDLDHAEKEWDKTFLRKALQQHNNNVSQTAKTLKIRYETLHRKIKALGL